MKITALAKKRWDRIPAEFKMRLLHNVWCCNCRTSVNIDTRKMYIKQRMLVLEGSCMSCQGPVCRAIEPE